jgi:hypothetical protein
MWLHEQLKPLFADDVRNLVNQSNKCVEKLGDYAKK